MDPPRIYMDMLRMCIRGHRSDRTRGVVYIPEPVGVVDTNVWCRALVRRISMELGVRPIPKITVERMGGVGAGQNGLKLTLKSPVNRSPSGCQRE